MRLSKTTKILVIALLAVIILGGIFLITEYSRDAYSDAVIEQYKSLSGEVTGALGVFEKEKEIGVQFESKKEEVQPKLTEEAQKT